MALAKFSRLIPNGQWHHHIYVGAAKRAESVKSEAAATLPDFIPVVHALAAAIW
jgi:hypothetical protein